MNLLVPPIPARDYLFLPGPAWLLVLLLTAAFYLHVLFFGTVLGSAFFLLVRRVRAIFAGTEIPEPFRGLDRQLDQRLLKALPPCISLTITFGVAALLFVQCLYGPYFYSANIFIALFWMLILLWLLIGFVSAYLAKLCWNRTWSLLFILILPLMFLAILYTMTNNAVLTIIPDHWLTFHRRLAQLRVPDPIVWPRLLHNLGAVFVISGLAVAWIGRYRTAKSDIPQARRAEHATRAGMQWLIVGMVMQIPFGLWYLFSIPGPLRANLVNFSTPASGAWYAALALAAVTICTALKSLLNPVPRRWLILTTALPLIGLVGMVLARQQLRHNYLALPTAGSFNVYDTNPVHGWTVQPQPAAMITFFVTLAAGLLLVAAMLFIVKRQAYQPAPAPPEEE